MSTAIARDINFTRWLFRAYLLLLFLVPLPLGSNRPLFWSLLVTAVAALTLIWGVGWFSGVARWPSRIRGAKWAFILLAGFVVWAGARGYFTTEIAPTSDSLLLSIGFLLLAFLTIALVRSKRRALLVLYTLVLAGLLQAIYGSLMMLSGVEWGFFAQKEFNRGLATGTFVNRNHYANLLVLSLSAGFGLLLAQMNLQGAQNMRQRLRSLLQAALGPKARLRIYMVVTVIALVLTRSRMGNASFFAALTLVGLFAWWRLRLPSRPLMVLVISVLVIDVFVVGTWFGVEQVIDRLQKTVQVEQNEWVIQDKNRIDTDRESLQIIRQKPIAGWGGGSFYTVYPAWRGDDQMFMDHAHNDYLEFAVEYGLVGLALLGVFVLLCFLQAARGLRDRDTPRTFGFSFASAMAIVAMMIHASVDFNLQIPANAAWFIVLCILPFTIRD
ncbi:MAG: O-antigen ligase family protein [Xanthomonadales bacterium]|nr:O-antigen ligase family protein [Xanthomonadales bacterium]